MSKRRRLLEGVKSLLIVILAASAVWLVSLTPLYQGSALETRVKGWFSPAGEPTQVTPLAVTAAARPLAIAVNSGEGCHGVQYDAEGVDGVMDALGPLLGEALESAGDVVSVDEMRWKIALQSRGIYFDFNGSVPLTALAAWLGGGEGSAPAANVRRVAVTEEGKRVWLFWQEEESGAFFGCETDMDFDRRLLPALTQWLPNAAFFAFQREAYAACDPYTLITDAAQPAVYTAAVPLAAANTTQVDTVLEALSYSTASGSSYPISDGIRYTDGVNTFQLTSAGELTYHATEPFFLVSAQQGGDGLTAAIETTRRMVEDTLGRLCGEARLSLVSAVEADGETVVTYRYSLNGIPVTLYKEGWAARFVIREGAVNSFALLFRSYTRTSATTLLLPEPQAVAAMSVMETEGNELLLTYLDGGGSSVLADWIAN